MWMRLNVNRLSKKQKRSKKLILLVTGTKYFKQKHSDRIGLNFKEKLPSSF